MTLRRDFLGFTAGAVAARTILPKAAHAEAGQGDGSPIAPSPDAELIAVCAEFDAWQRRFLATDFEALGDDTPAGLAASAEQRCCIDAQDALLDRMSELRAVTWEGQAARARSLALWDAELMKPDPHDTNQRLTAAIVRDLLAEERDVKPGQEASTPPSAELLDRYSAWLDGERLALMRELHPNWDPSEAARFVPDDAFVRHWWTRTPPSSRALAVLGAAGIYVGPDTLEARRQAYLAWGGGA